MLLVDYLNKERRFEVDKEIFKNKIGIEKIKLNRCEIPSVTHLDFSARIQTVNGKYNKPFYDLINKFYNLTGCPVVINTSFNIRGEPIVESIKDAFNCFMGTNLDILICSNFYLEKEKQIAKQINNYKDNFTLD